MSRSDLFRWQKFEPFEQTIVSDGFQFWVHDAELEQKSVRFVSKVIEQGEVQLLAALVKHNLDNSEISKLFKQGFRVSVGGLTSTEYTTKKW